MGTIPFDPSTFAGATGLLAAAAPPGRSTALLLPILTQTVE